MHIIYVLDRSGSMGTIWDDAFEGLNRYIAACRQDDPQDTFTLVLFDHDYQVPALRQPLGAMEPVSPAVAFPRGSTALLDALGRTLERFRDERDVMLCVMTDGYENASRVYTLDEVKALIGQAQDEWGWEINFIGAGIDAIAGYGELGVKKMRNVPKSAAGMADAHDAFTAQTWDFKSKFRGSR